MLKFITLTEHLTQENRGKVFPFLFDYFYLKNAESLEKFSQVEDWKEAELAIFPLDINWFFKSNQGQVLFDFIKTANFLNIPVCIYSAGDFGISLKQNVYSFRMGGFNSKLDRKTFIIPSFLNDPVAEYFDDKWQALPKSEVPTIGFVGHADGGSLKLLKEFLIFAKQEWRKVIKQDFTDSQYFFPSSVKRYSVLKKLKRNKGIKTNFIFRKKYRDGAITATHRENSTLEFFENINENLYTFCLRGSGNFSVRFYETLFMGRIPVLVDTDCRLPFPETINWKNHCVFTTNDNVEETLLKFHRSKSETEILEIQNKNRNLMLKKLNRITFFESAFAEIVNSKSKY